MKKVVKQKRYSTNSINSNNNSDNNISSSSNTYTFKK